MRSARSLHGKHGKRLRMTIWLQVMLNKIGKMLILYPWPYRNWWANRNDLCTSVNSLEGDMSLGYLQSHNENNLQNYNWHYYSIVHSMPSVGSPQMVVTGVLLIWQKSGWTASSFWGILLTFVWHFDDLPLVSVEWPTAILELAFPAACGQICKHKYACRLLDIEKKT